MSHKQRPPQHTHSFIDSCAFDSDTREEAASRRILDKSSDIIVAHSVMKELDHPNTPNDVKRMGQALLYTSESELSPELLQMKSEIRTFIQGNANPGKHKGDADHLFELYKYGGGYFITTDRRLLSRSNELFQKYFITTIKPSEYEKLL